MTGNGEALRLATVLHLLRQQRRFLTTLAVVGVAVGLVLAAIWPSTYESRTRVLLQEAHDPDEVMTQVEVAMSMAVLDRAAADLSWDAVGADLRGAVSVEPTRGRVIQFRARWSDPPRARELADAVTQAFTSYSADLGAQAAGATKQVLQRQQDDVQRQLDELNARIAELQRSFELLDPRAPEGAGTRAELEQLRLNRANAVNTLSALDQQIGEADLSAAAEEQSQQVIEPAAEASSPLPPTPVHLVLGSAGTAVILGAAVVVTARLNDHRLRRRSDIAAAIGAPVLAVLPLDSGDGTDESTPRPPGGTWQGLARRLRPGPVGPPPQVDEAAAAILYRRVLEGFRVRAGEPSPLIVLTLDKDRAAAAAVQHLTATIADPAVIVHTEELSAARPVLPAVDREAPVLVVVSAGIATAWELVGVAEACREARRPVSAVVVVGQVEEEDLPSEPDLPVSSQWRTGHRPTPRTGLAVTPAGHRDGPTSDG